MKILYPAGSIVYFDTYQSFQQGIVQYVSVNKEIILYKINGFMKDFKEEELTSNLDDACKRWLSCKGDWEFECSSGYNGHRCQKCSNFVYQNEIKICDCDN